jgi:flagellar M-ring protein FliF
MEKVLQQLTAFLKGLSLRQRVILVASVLLVGGTVWLFVYLFSGGDYKVLYSGMSPADAQSLVQKLAGQNIQSQTSPDGASVLVRSDQLDRARLEAAAQGPLASGRMGFELFDKPNWSGSDFSEKVNYQRALEAELERTIQTMSGVEGVRVHLVLSRESLFADREHAAKAAVVLKLRGVRLNDQISASVANLVSSAWDDLTPQNVTVVTTDGQMPGPSHGRTSLAAAGNQELETTLAERIVQTLSPVVGSDHVKSSITIDYDSTSGDSTQEVYDPSVTAVLTSQVSQETVGDLEPAGIPGTPSNTPNSPGNTAAVTQPKTASTTQGIRSESKTFAVSHTTRHLLEHAGRIRRVAVAILVDDAIESKPENSKTQEVRRKRTPEEMKQIEDLAKAAIGFDEKRGDLFSLQNMTFRQVPTEVPEVPSKIQRFLTFAERWTALLRYAALFALFALVYFLILRPVKKQFIHILQVPQLAAAGGNGALSASVEGQLGATAADAAMEVPNQIQQTISLKRQIVAKVKEDPEVASRLIQNWIVGDGEKR